MCAPLSFSFRSRTTGIAVAIAASRVRVRPRCAVRALLQRDRFDRFWSDPQDADTMIKRAHVGRFVTAVVFILAAGGADPTAATSPDVGAALAKLDPILQRRAAGGAGTSLVIVRAVDSTPATTLADLIQQAGGKVGRKFGILRGRAGDVPNAALTSLASSPYVVGISLDRVIVGANERTGATIGSTGVRQDYGYDGSGVGVAIIDSGVAPAHDDLSGGAGQRVDRFVDFVNGRTATYDDYGHGNHVAGIIAGNGFDSSGARSGVAPGARLTVLKVLDGAGSGRISDVIAAIDYVVANKDALNIRVINLSVATGVYESYDNDPLTLATQRAVLAGIVVVAAAGNNGRDALGRPHHGGVTAPGNAPWVLTVGASSHMGTVDRSDDTVAPFSSRGPGAIDYAAKPDVVAPGVGIESLSDPASTFYTARASYLLPGTVATSYLPYLSLSGTSMSAPVVAGTVALMLQANPSLTPNEVKAILQYTAELYPGYDRLTEGAGFLNARGAVELARYLASPATVSYPSATTWTARFIWGNRLLKGGRFTASASAWATDVLWGADTTASGSVVEFGVLCTDTACSGHQPWRVANAHPFNVVWGDTCAGGDCVGMAWSATVVWGTDDEGDTVVWGTSDEGDTVVWGTSDDEGDTVVWGTSCTDPACNAPVWPH
jgi:serine protease AprX